MPLNKIYRQLDTNSLIQKCIERDPIAWSEFTLRFSWIASRAIEKRLKNHRFQFNKEDTDDLKQGFFMKLWQEKSLQKVKHSSSINYWVSMVAANFATDFYRRSQKDVLKNAISIFEEVVINNRAVAIKNFIKSNGVPREKNKKESIENLIGNTFSELSPKEKIALKLNIYHNKKHREISKILKLSLGNVASLLSRAKLKIRKNLQEGKENA